ncbi:MAG TPA: hypothetical protein VGL82_16735 [Bryobacteraceae bacterium]
MSKSLQIYLHDHYSGATFAVELLKALSTTYSGDELGQFAGEILTEVNQDRELLMNLIQQIGSAGPDLKDVAGWTAEKASRLKLRHDDPEGLGAFEALEALSLGILGKRALWVALRRIAEVDSRVKRPDFEVLARGAEDQFNRVEEFRLRLAPVTFSNG